MSSNVTIDSEGTVTGNTFDKYGSENPVVRRLMSRFHRDLDACYSLAAPTSILDIGCGEGVLTHEWAGRLGDGRIVGVDLDDPLLHAQWEQRKAPNLEYRVMKGERLDFADNEFDTSTAIEVLEHVTDPEMVLSEMARCAERWLIVSVPREPLWRIAREHARARQPLVKRSIHKAPLPLWLRGRTPSPVPVDHVGRPHRWLTSQQSHLALLSRMLAMDTARASSPLG